MDRYPTASVRVLPRLHDPQSPLSLIPFRVLEVVLRKLLPDVVPIPLDVEGHRQEVEHVLALLLIEGLHVVVKRLLIPQKLVVLEMVVNLNLLEVLFLLPLRLHSAALDWLPLPTQVEGLLLELGPVQVGSLLVLLLTQSPPPSFLERLLYQMPVIPPPNYKG